MLSHRVLLLRGVCFGNYIIQPVVSLACLRKLFTTFAAHHKKFSAVFYCICAITDFTVSSKRYPIYDIIVCLYYFSFFYDSFVAEDVQAFLAQIDCLDSTTGVEKKDGDDEASRDGSSNLSTVVHVKYFCLNKMKLKTNETKF